MKYQKILFQIQNRSLPDKVMIGFFMVIRRSKTSKTISQTQKSFRGYLKTKTLYDRIKNYMEDQKSV